MPKKTEKIDATEYKKIKISEFIDISKWVFSLLFSISPAYTIIYVVVDILKQLQTFVWTFILARTIDQLIKVAMSPNPNISDMYPYLGYLIAYNFVTTAIGFMRNFSYVSLNNLSRYKVKQKFYYKLKGLGIQTLEDPNVNDKMFRANNYLPTVVNYYQGLIDFISEFIRMIAAMIIVFKFMPIFVPIMIAITIPYILYDKKLRSLLYKFDFENTEGNRKSGATSGDLSQPRTLEELMVNKAFGFMDKKYIAYQTWYMSLYLKIQRRWAGGNYFFSFMADIGVMYGYLQIFLKLISKQITVGQVTFYMRTLDTLQGSITTIASSLSNLGEKAIQIKDTYTLFTLQPRYKDGSKSFAKLSEGPEIILKNLSFNYPNTEKLIYDNFNIKIKTGEKIAIVGPNGAGKTTLIRLISRMYKPTAGQILINGEELDKMKGEDWYQNLGVMYQEYNTYPQLTVKENIYIGNPEGEIDEIAVRLAAQAADAMSFIEEYPNKFDQVLSEKYKGGIRPSTGQWQKIAIARFFYRNAPLVIFDEPTASIDAVSEYNIFNKIYDFFKGKTVILISHRYSTVRNADRIIYIEKGKILEEGSHEKLMSKNGSYARAFRLQAEGYSSE